MASQSDDAVPVEEIDESGTSTTWLLIYTAIVLVVVHQVYNYTYFWRLGVPGPMPLPLVGHFVHVGVLKGFLPALNNWKKQYGDYFGIYMGTSPTLLIADAELARHILIKDFPNFQTRTRKEFSMPYLADSILEASGEVWKRGRSYISPTFSGSKLKYMAPDINSKCDIMLEVLAEKTKGGESVNLRDILGPYIMDNVACCAYGLQSDCQRDPNDMFFVNAKKLLDFNVASPGILLRMIFPFLAPFWNKFRCLDMLSADIMNFFANIVKKTIEMRQEGGATDGKKDFLQLMIAAAEAGGEDPIEGEENGQVESTKPRKKIPFTQNELIGQSLLFFFAGYETVAATTSFAAYAIARYPEIQKKVHEELDELTSEGEIKYEAVAKMEYLDKVWCESQRMWPIAFALERICTKEFTYNGRTIPEGQYINIFARDIHFNPEYWPNPETFNPENFSKEAKENRKPCTFLPFGNGPRACVAMRFANLEGKIGLARILQKYTLQLDPKTPDLDDVSNLGMTPSIYPPKGIHIRFVPRE